MQLNSLTTGKFKASAIQARTRKRVNNGIEEILQRDVGADCVDGGFWDHIDPLGPVAVECFDSQQRGSTLAVQFFFGSQVRLVLAGILGNAFRFLWRIAPGG